jgi:iron complex outermembrane receptor protein
MKLTFILSLTICLQVSAVSFSQRFNINLRNASVTQVFKEIERQSGYTFWYKSDLLQKSDKVTVSLKNAKLEEVLESCFANEKIEYSIVDKTIVLKPAKVAPVLHLSRWWQLQ